MRMDYRDIPQKKYDKITCLEMAEHVGVKNFKTFMSQIYNLLKDDGLFYLQIAALRERESPLWGPNMEDIVWGLFMNKYIFSGADASKPLNWDLRRIEEVGFEVHSVENVGIHYSRTIDAWYHNWMRNEEKVMAKYGQEVFRMYQVFLGWSVEIAAQGSSTAYQIVCNKNLDKFNRERWVGARDSRAGRERAVQRDSVVRAVARHQRGDVPAPDAALREPGREQPRAVGELAAG